MDTLPTSRRSSRIATTTLRATRDSTIPISNIQTKCSLVSRTHHTEEVTEAASAVTTTMAQTDGCLALVHIRAILQCRTSGVAVLDKPSFQTYRGLPVLVHEAVAQLLRLLATQAHNHLHHPLLNRHQRPLMQMTIPSDHPRTLG